MKTKRINIMYVVLALLLITDFTSGKFSSPGEWFYHTIIMLPGIIVGISFHEFAHGIVSYRLGDPTPKEQGRLTLNPMEHFDFTGFIALIFIGFGWGKPVQINRRYYKHPRLDEFLVSIAGVITNFILAIIFGFMLKLLIHHYGLFDENMTRVLQDIIISGIVMNLVLMVFNSIPIPPLDGFGMVTQIFDLRKYSWYPKVYQNSMMILLVLVVFNIFEIIMNPCVHFLYRMIITYIVG